MMYGRATERLGVLRYGLSSRIRIYATDHPDWPLKIWFTGFSNSSAPICADGLVPLVELLLDAAEWEGAPLRRFRWRLVGRIDCSTWFRRVTHSVRVVGAAKRPILVVHRRRASVMAYRLTADEAAWMADLIAGHFAAQ